MRASFLLFIFVSIGLVSCGKSEQELAEEARQIEAEKLKRIENEKIAIFKSKVLDSLKDPESAQFKNLRLVKGEGGEALCGEVNAKNSYGGYIGFSQFGVTEKLLKNSSSNVILLNSGGDYVASIVHKLRLQDAGCLPPMGSK